MSFHRENIIWQSKNGTWSIGFWRCYETGDHDDEDFDPEWDVEYDHSEFEWASVGHPTQEKAMNAWTGSNPGSHEVQTEVDADSDRYDAMAKKWLDEEAEREKEYRKAYPRSGRRGFFDSY